MKEKSRSERQAEIDYEQRLAQAQQALEDLKKTTQFAARHRVQKDFPLYAWLEPIIYDFVLASHKTFWSNKSAKRGWLSKQTAFVERGIALCPPEGGTPSVVSHK